MKITTRFIYGLRMVTYIRQRKGPVRMSEMTAELGISKKYLEKLAHCLTGKGILSTVRGPAGGYKIDPFRRTLSLYDLYIALEGDVEQGLCYRNSKCNSADCSTMNILNGLNKHIKEYLKKHDLLCTEKGVL